MTPTNQMPSSSSNTEGRSHVSPEGTSSISQSTKCMFDGSAASSTAAPETASVIPSINLSSVKIVGLNIPAVSTQLTPASWGRSSVSLGGCVVRITQPTPSSTDLCVELVVVGPDHWLVTRASSSVLVCSPLAQNELGRTTCVLEDGDVVRSKNTKGDAFRVDIQAGKAPEAKSNNSEGLASCRAAVAVSPDDATAMQVVGEAKIAETSKDLQVGAEERHEEGKFGATVKDAKLKDGSKTIDKASTEDAETKEEAEFVEPKALLATFGPAGGTQVDHKMLVGQRDTKEAEVEGGVVVFEPKPAEKDTEPTASEKTTPDAEKDENEEYHWETPRDGVLEILESIDSPGAFAAGGSCDGRLTMPGLEVDGIGTIGLPLSETQARVLAARFDQAPFGRGSETLVDKTVRNTWQLSPGHFKLTNPQWTSQMNQVVSNVRDQLGVQAHLRVEAQLYKLLLYEKGSFFKTHRDSEKVDGMFGTLVIVLPSAFTGGELVVKHAGDIKAFEQASGSGFGSQYMAFYADCQHELKAVTSGHRLCLVYNLVKVGTGPRPSAVDSSVALRQLRSAAEAWGRNYCGNKLVIMTDHMYTPDGMRGGGSAGSQAGGGSAKFKGKDAVMVHLLELAADEGIDLDWDHGTVRFSESGYAEGEGYYSSGFEWCDTTESDLTLELDAWGSLSINQEDEMIPEDFYEDKEGEETFEPTGNEGVNAERQYDDENAIVVWPRSQRWRIVTNNDVNKMCDYLLKACTAGTADSESKSNCATKAKAVIQRVVAGGSSSSYSHAYDKGSSAQSNVSTLMRCLVLLGDSTLALDSFLKPYVASRQGTPDLILPELRSFMDCFGCASIQPHLLGALDAKQYAHDPAMAASFVIKVFKLVETVPEYSSVTLELVKSLVEALHPVDHSARLPLRKKLSTFPVKDLLALFCGESCLPGSSVLAARVIEALTWASCQKIEVQQGYYSHNTTVVTPKGPTMMLSAGLAELCETHGWQTFEACMTDMVSKLCLHGSVDSAVALVEELAPSVPSVVDAATERQRVCSILVAYVCQAMLNRGGALKGATAVETHTKFFKLIVDYCPSSQPEFLAAARKLDVDTILVPLATSVHKLVTAGRVQGRESSSILTKHCVDVLSSRLAHPLATIQVWTIPGVQNDSTLRSLGLTSFLNSPCKQTWNEKLAKKEHAREATALNPLVRAKEITCQSYQPGGRGLWYFKVTKLRQRSLANGSASTCDCSKSSGYGSYGYSRSYESSRTSDSNCLVKRHKETFAKRAKDETTLNSLIQLLPSEDRRDVQRKRKVPSSTVPAMASSTAASAASAAASSSTGAATAKKPRTAPAEIIDLT